MTVSRSEFYCEFARRTGSKFTSIGLAINRAEVSTVNFYQIRQVMITFRRLCALIIETADPFRLRINNHPVKRLLM